MHNLKGRFESISEFYDGDEFRGVVEGAVSAACGRGIEFLRIHVFPRGSDRIMLMYVDCSSSTVRLLLYDAVRESLVEGPSLEDVIEAVGAGGQVEVYSLSGEEVMVDYEIIESRALIDGLSNYAINVSLNDILGREAMEAPERRARPPGSGHEVKPAVPSPQPRRVVPKKRVLKQRAGDDNLVAALEPLVDDGVLSRKVSDPAFMARVLLTPPETEAVLRSDFTSLIDTVLKDGGGRVVTVILGDGSVLHILVNGTGKVGVCLSGAWGKVCGREALRRLRKLLSSGGVGFVSEATVLTYRIGGA